MPPLHSGVRERVCILTSVHTPFDGRIFHRQAKTLVRGGYEVTMIAPADLECQERDGIAILGVPKPASRAGRPLVWWRIYRKVRAARPDVIHFHDPELLLIVPLLRLALGRHVRIVYDVHEYFIVHVANKYWIPPWIRPFAAAVTKSLEKLLARMVDGIICAVDGQKELYEWFRGPVAVVRNFPVAALFADAAPHPDMAVEGFKLIYVGLILPERGIDVVLEAMRILDDRDVRDVHLFLIGPDTSPAYTTRAKEFSRENCLDDRIHWLGFVPHHQIKNYLAAADAGVASGLAVEQYSNPGITTKLFEYMVCGLPVISVDYPHRRVYIEEQDCGILVPPADASAHADAILRLRDNPAEAAAMGRRARDMVIGRYSWELEESRLLAFYRDLVRAEADD